MTMGEEGTSRREQKLPENPRRVRGGVKLASRKGPVTEQWAGVRWLRWAHRCSSVGAIEEGLEYARLGQTRRMELESEASALVQGRADRAYRTRLSLRPFSETEWECIIDGMVAQPKYAAKMLSGDVPSSIEELFTTLGLRLFPGEPADAEVSCTCSEPDGWCKHVSCVATLIAERLGEDPSLIFALRGLPAPEVNERVRQRRAISGSAQGSATVYVPRIGASEEPAPPLESCIERFWDAGADLATLDLPVEKPVVSHPLLRRLGPSPFKDGKFPLVGLLATCYELISDAALLSVEDDDEAPSEQPDDQNGV
jgi:uncharacterized Zn finger protein